MDLPALIYFDLAKRTNSRILDIAHKPVFGSSAPTLSPDGRSILYSQVDRWRISSKPRS